MKTGKRKSRPRPETILPTPREAAALARVEEYLAESRLSWMEVSEALRLEDEPDIPHAHERLTSDELTEVRRLGRYVQEVFVWATGVWICAARDGDSTLRPTEQFVKFDAHDELVAPPVPSQLPEADKAAVLAALAQLPAPRSLSFAIAYTKQGEPPHPIFIDHIGESVETATLERLLEDHSPDYRTANARATALWERCKLTPAEHAERLTGILTREDGTRAPSPFEWCALHAVSVSDFRTGLYFAQVRELSRREETIGALQREIKKEKRRKGLADRVVFPAQVIHAGYRPQVQAELYRKAVQGELFPHDAETLAVLSQSADVAVGALAHLKGPAVRAMVGVFRAFTTKSGLDGTDSFLPYVEIAAPVLYRAMGLDTPSDSDRRRHFDALMELSATPLSLAVTAKRPDGKGYVVQAVETPMFAVSPTWGATVDGRRGYTAEEANEIAAQWRQRTRTAGTPWEGPLPDLFRIQLPAIMQVVAERLVLTAETFDKLEAGAKEIRGASERFSALDWRVLIEITQTTQKAHKGRAFVDRNHILEEHYGKAAVRKQRAKGKLKTGYGAQYEKSVSVIEAGGIARRIHKDYRKAKRGEVRDVFEILEDVVLRREQDTETLPLLLAETPKPSSAPKRRRTKGAQ